MINGRLTGSFSSPLMSILTNSEKLLPLFAMPQIRIVLTHESRSKMFRNDGGNLIAPATSVLSNAELRYIKLLIWAVIMLNHQW